MYQGYSGLAVVRVAGQARRGQIRVIALAGCHLEIELFVLSNISSKGKEVEPLER